MTGGSRLRTLLQGETMVVAPGAYDGLTAKLVAQAGFSAVYMTGAGTSVSHGYPDFGLLTMSEMVENAGRIVRAVNVPVIADADTGYGNELNVFRTVQEYQQRGVAGIHIEDQVSPKKCGHLDDKEIVSTGRLRGEDQGGRRGEAGRFHDHRADRCAGGGGAGRGRGAGECGARRWCRHGVCRSAADDG